MGRDEELFRQPLKAGDRYITMVSNRVIPYTFSEKDLANYCGTPYSYYMYLSKTGAASIGPGLGFDRRAPEDCDLQVKST